MNLVFSLLLNISYTTSFFRAVNFYKPFHAVQHSDFKSVSTFPLYATTIISSSSSSSSFKSDESSEFLGEYDYSNVNEDDEDEEDEFEFNTQKLGTPLGKNE